MEGVDYFFVSKEQFEEWIRSDELLEWALVYGEYKGIPKTQVLRYIIYYQNYILETRWEPPEAHWCYGEPVAV